MTDTVLSIKKNLYEMMAAIVFLVVFYIKNKLIHNYFSYGGILQSIRYKILKVEKLSQLLLIFKADRAVLYELAGKSFLPTAYSIKDGIGYFPNEKIDNNSQEFKWKDLPQTGFINLSEEEVSSIYSMNSTSSIIYSKIKDSAGKLTAIILLHYISYKNQPESEEYKVLNDYKIKIKDILQMEKEQSKKLMSLLITFLLRCIKLITIKNIFRIALLIFNYRIIQSEISKEVWTTITIPVYSSDIEIPLVVILLLLAIATTILSENLFTYFRRVILRKALGQGRFI